jgi:NADPH-dependent curcumin reductase CurA
MTLNQRIVLASRPVGAPTPENFRMERVALPDLADGQVLLKTVFLSLDPYMRGRMSDAPSYAAPVEIGEVMTGGAVSRVERSLNPKFQEGDLVVGATGWQSHSINDGHSIIPIPTLPSPSMALGVLGMPAKPWWLQRRPGRWVRWSARWRRSRGCGWLVWQVERTSAVMWSTS